FELLNGPCPPGFEHCGIPRTGDGKDSINVRCSGSKEVIDIYLPTSEEILGEILREYGAEPLPDEKRSAYLPVIHRFGGPYLAGAAFSGTSGAILRALEKGPKTISEIKGLCKLGDGTVPGESYLQRTEQIFSHASERLKRVGRKRFARYAKNQAPETLKLTAVLEFWADRGILNRQWKVGPCPRCHKTDFVPRLDIQKRLTCRRCGNGLTLHESVPIGYSLDRTVSLALEEGIVPVVLAGRFLRNMTNRGFFWLPGVKFRMGEKQGDIDLLAC